MSERPVIKFAPVTGPVKRVRPVVKFDMAGAGPVPGASAPGEALPQEVSGLDLWDLVQVCKREEV